MTAPLILLGYALVVGTAGARWLQHLKWPQRSPGLGILVWQALSGSVVLSVVLAGTALALPALPVTADLADLLHACALAVQAHYATPGGAAVAVAGATLATAVIGRLAYCMVAGWSVTRRLQTVQRGGLALVARRHVATGAMVLQHHTPAVYCMPGRGGEVVLTTAALDALNGPEVAAVFAHERAHMRRRHDIVLVAASALRAAFPFIPLFGIAKVQSQRLVEMHADDVASRSSDRRVLATALVRLAGATHPAGTLGAGGDCALARVRRLTNPVESLGMARSVLAVTAAVAVVVMPLLIGAAPAVAAAAMDYCPVGFPA